MSGQALALGHLARPLQTIDRRERDLLLLGVLARGFPERFGRLLDVQHVVDDLKRQADMLAIAGQRAQLFIALRPRRCRPCAGWPAAARRS